MNGGSKMMGRNMEGKNNCRRQNRSEERRVGKE